MTIYQPPSRPKNWNWRKRKTFCSVQQKIICFCYGFTTAERNGSHYWIFFCCRMDFFSTTDTTNDEVFLFVVVVVNVIMLLLLLWNSQVLLSRLYLRLVLIIIERTAPAMTSKINKRSVFCSSFCLFEL